MGKVAVGKKKAAAYGVLPAQSGLMHTELHRGSSRADHIFTLTKPHIRIVIQDNNMYVSVWFL